MFFICYSCFALFPKGNQKRPAAWMLFAKSFGINRMVSYKQKTHLTWHKISKTFAYFTNLTTRTCSIITRFWILTVHEAKFFQKMPLKNILDHQNKNCGLYSILNATQNSFKRIRNSWTLICLISLNLDRFCCTKNSSTPDLYKMTLVMYVLGLVCTASQNGH